MFKTARCTSPAGISSRARPIEALCSAEAENRL
jgi:hypothetical protein